MPPRAGKSSGPEARRKYMEQGTTKKTPHGAALSCQKMVRQLNGLYNFSAIMLARFCDEGVLCHTQAVK